MRETERDKHSIPRRFVPVYSRLHLAAKCVGVEQHTFRLLWPIAHDEFIHILALLALLIEIVVGGKLKICIRCVSIAQLANALEQGSPLRQRIEIVVRVGRLSL